MHAKFSTSLLLSVAALLPLPSLAQKDATLWLTKTLGWFSTCGAMSIALRRSR